MLRRHTSSQFNGVRKLLTFTPSRGITGVSPTIFIPKLASKDFGEHEKQIQKNTEVALELIRCVKGPKPQPYERKFTDTFQQLSDEVENLLGSSAQLRRDVRDYEPLDKLTAMERALRHVIWSYIRDDSSSTKNFEDPSFNAEAYFAEMEKWLCYTTADGTRLATLRDDFEKNQRFYQLKKARLEALKSGSDKVEQITQPTMDLESEYKNAVDRETIVEKRIRYNNLSIKTTLRDDAAIEAENAEYVRPTQAKRLDQLFTLLEAFKPLLAREAINQRLTIKHLEGQLGVWRYLDWNPEVRDRAELEADNCCQQWWMPNEEKRLTSVRLLSKNELSERAEKHQSTVQQKTASRATGDDKAKEREALLQEIIQLQQRIGRKEADEDAGAAQIESNNQGAKAEEVVIHVDARVVKEKGLFGLTEA